MKSKIAIFALIILISLPCFAQDDGEDHNCRFVGVVSQNMPQQLIRDLMIEYPYSLERLSESVNVDGWGISSYQSFGDTARIWRGAIRAHNDPDFDGVVEILHRDNPNIVIGHVRNCSAGCCAPDQDSIPDPHPFVRVMNDRTWTFVHNGTADKTLLYQLVGEEYLAENPLTGSGIEECDPSDSTLVIDSELYFLLLMKNIEEANWNVSEGIIEALRQINVYSWDEALNFILSDGYNLWTYRLDRTLYYYNAPWNEYTAIASRYPFENQEDWIRVWDHQLLEVRPGQQPQLYDVCDYLPYFTGTVTDPLGELVNYTYVNTTNAPFSSRSQVNGVYYLFCLASGTYDLRYRHNYYADTIIYDVGINLDDLEVIQDLVIRFPGKVTGIVSGPDGNPLEDIKVTVRGTSHRAFTNEFGYYHMDSLDLGDFEISFTSEYYSDTSVYDVLIQSDITTEINMSMRYPAYITGILTDSSGQTVSDIVATLANPAKSDTSGADGVIVFDSLNSGDYEITFSHMNYADTVLRDVIANPGDTTDVSLELYFLGYAYLLGDANMYHAGWPPRRIGNDVTYILSYLRGIEECPPCSVAGAWISADVTGDCEVLGADISRMVSYYRGMVDLTHCPSAPPQWFENGEAPEERPVGWPPCENLPDTTILRSSER